MGEKSRPRASFALLRNIGGRGIDVRGGQRGGNADACAAKRGIFLICRIAVDYVVGGGVQHAELDWTTIIQRSRSGLSLKG